jgi:hypothetical protein
MSGDFDHFGLKSPLWSERGPTVGEIWQKEEMIRRAEEALMVENAKADAKAVWPLADYYMPPDVREMADRWGMKETLIEMWRGAFIEGWRAANRR